jgi:hypothetical protein
MVGSAASAEMLRRLEQLARDEPQQVAAGDDADQGGELFEGNCQLPLHRFLDCQLVCPR